jgi:beta-lactamase superfamily II metal-dependent hydrolase
MSDDIRTDIIDEIKRESKGKGIVRFISTHPDQDHIRGLVELHQSLDLVNFYCTKNDTTKEDETEDFNQYCDLRDNESKAFYIKKGSTRRWMNKSSDERGSAGISILWPIIDNPHYKAALEDAHEGYSANNISIIAKYKYSNGADIMWMGDLDTEFMGMIENEIQLSSAHILFAPHHGRDSGKVPQSWLDEIDPKLIVVGEAPSEHLHYYPNYNTITQNSAGDITFECIDGKTHIYVSNEDYSVSFLRNEYISNRYGTYIGTLITK